MISRFYWECFLSGFWALIPSLNFQRKFDMRISSFPRLHFFFASSHNSCLYATFHFSPKNFFSHNLMKSPTSASSRLFLHFFLSCPASKSMSSVWDFQLRIGQVQDFFRYMDIIAIPAQNLFRLIKPVQQSRIFHIAFILPSEKKTARAVRLGHSFSLFELQFWVQQHYILQIVPLSGN